MKRLIIFMLAIFMIGLVLAQTDYYTYYKLNLDYDYGKINISSINIEFSKENIENAGGFYIADVRDYGGNLLNLTFFDVPNKILWDGIYPETEEIDRGGEMELNQTSFEIFVPYYENAKEILIYNENLTEIARRGISEYSKQRTETREKEANENEEDIGGKNKTYENRFISKNITEYWGVLLIILIILIIALIYSLTKNRINNL